MQILVVAIVTVLKKQTNTEDLKQLDKKRQTENCNRAEFTNCLK